MGHPFGPMPSVATLRAILEQHGCTCEELSIAGMRMLNVRRVMNGKTYRATLEIGQLVGFTLNPTYVHSICKALNLDPTHFGRHFGPLPKP